MSVLITDQALHQSGPLVQLHDGSVVGFIEIAVTVVSSGGDKYAMDGSTQGTVTIEQGKNYYFNVSDSSVGSHPLQFSTTSDGTHGGGSAYTTGVTVSGSAGSAGAYVLLETDSSTPATLYYYCSSHSGMGGSVFKNTFASHSVDASVVSKDGKVGVGTISAGSTISHKLDVNGDIRIRGNNIRDNGGNAAITFDGSANTQIDGNLTVAGSNTVTLNGVTYTFPSSDGTSGQFLSTNGGGTLSFATASGGGGSSETVATLAIEYDNACFDLGVNTYTAKSTALTSLTIPASATVVAITIETTEAFAQNANTPNGQVMGVKLGDNWFIVKYNSESFGYISQNDYYISNTTTGKFGTTAFRYPNGGSSINPTIMVKGVTNDTAHGSNGYLTDGTITLKIYYTT